MNMGGGILLRTVARAAGSTTPAASTGFCSACTGQVARPSSLRTTSCRTCHHATLSQQAASPSNQVDYLDDWEFADETISESANRPFSASNALLFSPSPSASSHTSSNLADDSAPFENQFWRVFGLPPSVDEANAATSELQEAFFSSKDSVADEIKTTASDSTTSECEAPSTHEASTHKDTDTEEEQHYGEWVEPQLSMSQVQVARTPVQEAFQLLQSDPNVKGAVISIVSDPDVWHAMMKNEKVMELKRIFQKSQEKGEAKMEEAQQHPSKNEKHKCLDGVAFLLRAIVGMSRQVVWQVQDDISKIVMSIFSLAMGSKRGSEKEEDPFDKTMRSSMMLAVLVVTLVLMKRVQI